MLKTNEELIGNYTGIIDIIDINDKGPWALIEAEQVDDPTNIPMIQVKLSQDQYNELKENYEVSFELVPIVSEDDNDRRCKASGAERSWARREECAG